MALVDIDDLEHMDAILLPVIVFVTASISGVFGMAGGLALLALLLLVLDVEAAMVFHGAVQAAANGSRFWLHREHVLLRARPRSSARADGLCGAKMRATIAALARQPLSAYAIGIGVAFVLCVALELRIDAKAAYYALGCLTLCGLCIPRRWAPSFAEPRGAAACGAITGLAHLSAGVSGPVLDAFFVRGELARRTVLATKALTQTVAHVGKIAFFAAGLPSTSALPAAPIWVLSIACAFAGSLVGKRVVLGMREASFIRASRSIVAALGFVCIARGVALSM